MRKFFVILLMLYLVTGAVFVAAMNNPDVSGSDIGWINSLVMVGLNTLLLPVFLIVISQKDSRYNGKSVKGNSLFATAVVSLSCAIVCPQIYNIIWIIVDGHKYVLDYYMYDIAASTLWFYMTVIPIVFSVLSIIVMIISNHFKGENSL